MSFNASSQSIFSGPIILYELDGANYVIGYSLSLGKLDSLVTNGETKEYIYRDSLFRHEIYKYNDSVIIVKLQDSAVVFEDENQFLAVANFGFYSRVISQSVMFGKNKFGIEFERKSNDLALELLSLLNINVKEKVNYNFELVKAVEDKIFHMNRPFHFYRDYFSNILALLGNVLISNNPILTWKLVIDRDGLTWIPFLNNKGFDIPLFQFLYEQVFQKSNKNNPLTSLLLDYFQ